MGNCKVNVMMFGGRRCGKTSVIAAMKKCMEEEFGRDSSLIMTSSNSLIDVIANKEKEIKKFLSGSDKVFVPEEGKSCPTEILELLAKNNAEGRPIWKPMHMQPIYRMHGFVTREGNGRAKTNAYISGGTKGTDGNPLDVGMDIFHRGLCLPSDNKMTREQQDRIIEMVKSCFS